MKPLGVVRYYGGKAKMAETIISLLDFQNTDIYIEPFGGGGRVLLNKPRHAEEYYNDSSAGMALLFELLSSRDTAFSLIRRLYDTEYSEECFERSLQYRNEIEDNYLKETLRQLKKLLSRLDETHNTKMYVAFERLFRRVYTCRPKDGILLSISYNAVVGSAVIDTDAEKQIQTLLRNINTIIRAYLKHRKRQYDGVQKTLEGDRFELFSGKICTLPPKDKCPLLTEEERDLLIAQTEQTLLSRGYDLSSNDKSVLTARKRTYSRLHNNKLRDMLMDSAKKMDMDGMDIDEKIELAACTYVVYMQSRDGAGVEWGKTLYKTNDAYMKTIDRLLDVAHRLEDVHTLQIDAYLFFLDRWYGVESGFSAWDREEVMMYCDPTYLQEDRSTDVDDNGVRDIEEYNPGLRYKHYWTYEQHEKFLQCIQQAKCKILLSNYDDRTHLYKRYLEDGYGLEGDALKNFKPWHSFKFETATSISYNSSIDRARTEYLWYNYDR